MRSSRTVVPALVLCLTAASGAFAQNASRAVHFGVLGGAAFDKPGGADASNINGTYTGWIVGAFAALHLSPSFAIQPELSYVHKGAKIVETGTTGTLRLPYVGVPVLLKFGIPAKGSSILSPHVYAGPAVGFRTGCKARVSDGTTTVTRNCDEGTDPTEVKRTDFSLTFGGGVDVGRAIIDLRYDLGLTRIDGSTENNDIKHRTFYLLAGWSFRAP
ncbi:MAG TPA: porin family protein [Gemmatimonadales bacterium]|jgi:hypothetical protein|nr:porin family protein [Gemmatimonadales bacterium]